jgi:hypothetical protein
MKNITLSAEGGLIQQAREVAVGRKTTLNQLFRDWLVEVVGQKEREKSLKQIWEKTGYAKAGRKFTREEMNAR